MSQSELSGLTGPQIAEKVAAGEITANAARKFVLERAGNKFDQQVEKAKAA